MTDASTSPNSAAIQLPQCLQSAQPLHNQCCDLQASEQHFRAVLETMDLVGVVIDGEGTILLCNDPLLHLTGWQRHEVVGHNWFDRFIPPENRQVLRERVQGALTRGDFPRHHEHDILTCRGDRRLIAWHNTPMVGADGALGGITSLGQDITDQRPTERQLQEREIWLQRVADHLHGAMLRYVRHPSGTEELMAMSRGCADIWELEPERLQRHPELFWQAIHPDDRPVVQRLLHQSAEILTPWFCEWRTSTPSGQYKWLQGMGRPERLAQGGVAWNMMVFDVSDRRQADEAIREANQQMQAFIDNTPAMVNWFDLSGRYLRVNQATAAQFDLRPADLVGRSFTEMFPPSVVNTFMERVRHIATTQAPLTVEDTLHLNGQQKVFRSVLFPVTTEGDQVTVVGSVATDITPLVEAQMALRRQAEEERLIRTMTQRIRGSLDVNQILQTTVTEVRQFLQTDRVLIYRFSPDRSGSMVVESVLPPWRPTLGMTIVDTCFVTNPQLVEQYRQGRTSHIDDVYQAPIDPCHRNLMVRLQVQANLVVPINHSGGLWGLLCVHHCRSPRSWQPDEISLLTQLAAQVAIALQQSQLLAHSATLVRQEKLLNSIVRTISDSLDLATLLQRAVTEMLHTLKTSRSLVVLCQAEDETSDYTAIAVDPHTTTIQEQRIPIRDNPHVQRILSQDQPLAIDDVAAEPLLVSVLPQLRQRQIGAMLDVAIRYKGEVKGMLCAHQCPGSRPWTPEEARLMKRVADHLAIAIHQAELYAQAQAQLAERERLEAQLRHDASHDRLTGLPNRVLFLEQLALALELLHQPSGPPQSLPTASGEQDLDCLNDRQFAVLFLDLDRFKVINDSLGHAIGDRLLQVVAQRLQTCLQPTDTAARLGGDEFVVLLSKLSDAGLAIAMAQRIHAALQVPVLLDDHEVFIHASIGIALSSTAYTDPNQVLRDADIAMYKAKGSNREYAIFDAPMHTLVVQQMQLETDLRWALERDELRLHYQPIIDLTTDTVQGFEALVRWQHPHRGLVPPLDFIPIAENIGLITTLDLWTLNEACRQLNHWRQRFPHSHHLTVSVNLSGKQFVRPDLIQQIDAALARNGLQGQHLKIEITESVLIQNAQMAIDLLQELRQRCIQICMDDFGTGYSSLSYLHRFPIDVLKIDKSFIANLDSANPGQGDYEIIKAIISLATSLKLSVVAEGIETADQMQYLQAHDCQAGQGYYFFKPMTAAAATAFLAQGQGGLVNPEDKQVA